MNTVASVISRKNRPVVSITPGTPVLDALKLMAEQNIGAVVVLEAELYKGMVTERDYSRKVILKGKDSKSTPVEEIMSADLPHVKPGDSIDQCMQLMTSLNIRYLPVFDNNRLTGIISMSDVVKETIMAQKETISQLQNYISS